ncbi:transport and Golgi organization protein 1 homolog [Rhincodon typus]|uniref:transport and Golgi organization protein 1 homolog n=1 Tax=Rhincodon typus TaxID=259920 RepID=UPI00202F1C67|nr:transport and Golgi organization protein 1 homolog [Rhincodon typus]
MDYDGHDCRFLTFKSGDSILVYFKLVGKRGDLWAGSIGKQFGYFPKDAVQIEDVIVSTEIELPTKESDFLCLDGDYYVGSEESGSVNGEYGENSNSEEIKSILGHQSESNINSQDYKDAFSSGDALETGVTNNKQISDIFGENGQTNKDIQEQVRTKGITSEVMETPTLEMPLSNLSEKIPDLEKAAVKTAMETKLGNHLQKKSQDIKTDERAYDKTEEKMTSSSLNKDFEVKKSSLIINSKVKVAIENNNEYQPSVQKIDVYKVANSFYLDFQAIQILTNQFIKNAFDETKIAALVAIARDEDLLFQFD